VAKADEAEVLSIEGEAVRISHPEKLYFSRAVLLRKLDIVRYFLAVAPGALNGIRDRPIVLKRFVDGAEAEPFYQKRAPADLPSFLRTATLAFPSGRTAEEVVVDSAAGLAWVVNLGCMELHPHPVRTGDLEHPDQLRVDLDPGPGVDFGDVRRVALVVREVLEKAGLSGFVKTSGSRGMHINVPIEQHWSFTEVRRAALAVARAVERRVPALASSKWWKEERHGVFLDYNQNAKDRTTASAYSVRPLADARVSAPLRWDEVGDCDPSAFTVLTMPARFAAIGDPHAGFADEPGVLDGLLELADRDESEGLGDAPWPPHFRKAEGEGARVAPSRASKAAKKVANKGVRAKMPLVTVANSPDREAALAGLERWKAAHAEAAALLAEDDVLVDRMRGRSTIWYRIRVNLRHVPEEGRPVQGTPDPDDDPTRAS
jgi:bifunctional non-homologous end joining protein LigD